MADGLPSVLAQTLARLLPTPAERLAVAVSGGSDSLALALLAQAALPGRITALTVDHNLRPESAREAGQVGRWLATHDIPHAILRWDTPATTSLQEAARDARYTLMANWCVHAGISVLATGHTADDQAETLLARLARGAGLAGMAGIRAVRPLTEGVTVVRPLLAHRRADLQAWLQALGQPWISDPSNEDTRFERVRWRAALTQLPELTPDAVARTAALMADLDAQLDAAATDWIENHVRLRPGGVFWVSSAPAPLPELRLRALERVIAATSGLLPERPDVAAALTRCAPTTCGGVKLEPVVDGVLCMREAGRIDAHLTTPAENTLWDRRFRVTTPRDGEVRALGEAGWPLALAAWPGLRALDMPYSARCALPALWRGDHLLALGGGGNALATLLPASAQLDAEFIGIANMRHSPSLFLYPATIS